MKTKSSAILIVVAFGLMAALPNAHAVVPTPDGCYPNYTTAEGCNALSSLTAGAGNTGLGWYSLFLDTTGNFNTGVGAGALALSNGINNTATGAASLLLNTNGNNNTANGTDALVHNDSGGNNTAVGSFSLFSNITGNFNTATGNGALNGNTSGFQNTANGISALFFNTNGNNNTATGAFAFQNLSTGDSNTALGETAGINLVTGSGNVYIGADVLGEDGVSNSTYIRNVNTLAQPIVAGIDGVTVRLSDGRLGHGVSSQRYKQDIKPMDKASEALYALKPVTFHYKKEIDPTQTLDFGLIAEEVAKVNPELAVRDREGKISNYRRDAVNAMLLNEFLKEHRKVEEQKTAIAELKSVVTQQQTEFRAAMAEQRREFEARLEQQAAQIQKVTAQLTAASLSRSIVDSR
jgi:hypothetical protein